MENKQIKYLIYLLKQKKLKLLLKIYLSIICYTQLCKFCRIKGKILKAKNIENNIQPI